MKPFCRPGRPPLTPSCGRGTESGPEARWGNSAAPRVPRGSCGAGPGFVEPEAPPVPSATPVPAQVFTPNWWPSLRRHRSLLPGKPGSCDGARSILEAPQPVFQGFQKGLECRRLLRNGNVKAFDTKSPPAAETARSLGEVVLGSDSRRAVRSLGCTTPDKTKCFPDALNPPGRTSLSRSPVRSDE